MMTPELTALHQGRDALVATMLEHRPVPARPRSTTGRISSAVREASASVLARAALVLARAALSVAPRGRGSSADVLALAASIASGGPRAAPVEC
jgi:hypothetical protein